MDELTGFYAVRLIEEIHKGAPATWFAEHPELPQCHAVGLTQEAALENLDRTRAAWLSWAASHDVKIPDAHDAPAISVQYAIRRDLPEAKEAADVGIVETFRVPVTA